MANEVEFKSMLPAIGIGTAIVVSFAVAVRVFALEGSKARVSYQGGRYLVSVRYPGEWYDVREFIQPSDPNVVAVYSRIGPDTWLLLDSVCRTLSYRRDVGEFWQFPHETLARGQGDCEDSSNLLTSLLNNFTTAYTVLGSYSGYSHAWVEHQGQILETTYDRASPVPDPEDYCPLFIFNEREAVELWAGALEQVFALRRDEPQKLALMAKVLKT